MTSSPFRLRVLGLFLFFLLAASSGFGQTLASLLLKLESSTSFDGQTEAWHDLRSPWVERVNAASLGQVPALLLEYEANLKPESTDEGWRTRQAAWRAEVGRATRARQIADLMLELERHVTSTALFGSWNEERQTWITDVRTSAGQRQQSGSRTARPGATGSGPYHELAALVQRLESNTSYSAQVDGWSNDRQAWVAQCEAVNTARQLQAVLLTYEAKMKPESMSASWSFLRTAWVKKVKKARNARALADVIIEMDVYIKWAAHTGGWHSEREGWVREVAQAANYTLGTIPPREDRTPPEEETTEPDFGGNETPTNRWGRVAEMIQTVENSTSYDGQIENWREERSAYVDSTRAVSDLEGIRRALLGYDHSLKASSLNSAFDRENWRGRVEGANTAVDLADLAVELVENTNADAIGDHWRTGEMADWSTRIRSQATRADQGIEEPEPTPDSDGEVDAEPEPTTDEGRIAAALMNMEGNISYSAQTDEWMNGTIREAWRSTLQGTTLELATVREGLLTCEANMKPEAMKPTWAARRDAWRTAVQSETNAQRLAALLVELEENIVADSFFGNWSTAREEWRTKLNAIGQ